MSDLAAIRDLLERAMADLEKGWPEAAYDALDRAAGLARAVQTDGSSHTRLAGAVLRRS